MGDIPGRSSVSFAPSSFQKSLLHPALHAGEVRCNPGPFALERPSYILEPSVKMFPCAGGDLDGGQGRNK